MHLLDGVRTRLRCIPVVHEVAAGIAGALLQTGGPGRAFALVTAGPGLTNIITAMSGTVPLESRELLVLGGQVKSEDLLTAGVRQRGIPGNRWRGSRCTCVQGIRAHRATLGKVPPSRGG